MTDSSTKQPATLDADGGRRLSIAMIGTRGVPARYGGFETAVEEVGARLAARGHEVRVYCRNGNSEVRREHAGMTLVVVGILLAFGRAWERRAAAERFTGA